MMVLAVETATEACSAALYCRGTVHERYRLAPREHNRLILPMIESVLAEGGISRSQLDGLAFGQGPGSFTGLRIAAGVVQGLAFALDRPVLPVSTLGALAQEALEQGGTPFALPCLDARMGEVYQAVYRRGEDSLAELVGTERVLSPQAVLFPPEVVATGIGSGWMSYREALTEKAGGSLLEILEDRFPRASNIARLGAKGLALGLGVEANLALPVYLRDEVVRRPAGAY